MTWHEFADVKAPDVPLAEGATAQRLSSSLKPGGVRGYIVKKAGEGERSFSEDDPNRRSPNSDQWGLFVSLTLLWSTTLPKRARQSPRGRRSSRKDTTIIKGCARIDATPTFAIEYY